MTRGKSKLLVDARWLKQHRRDKNLVLVDTRPAKDYWAGHLKNARHFDPFPFHYYDSSPRGVSEFIAQLEWIFSALGITGRETVIFYEEQSGMRAARCLWLLEYVGHTKARMLDGGLKAAGEKLVTAAPRFEPTSFKAKPREEISATYPYISRSWAGPKCRFSTCAPTRNISASACARSTAARSAAQSTRTG